LESPGIEPMSNDWIVVDVWLADLQTPVHLLNLEPAQTFGQTRRKNRSDQMK
jgi:hypothetical protein